MDQLWSTSSTPHVESYEDAFGDEQFEEMQPMPPPSLTARGTTAASHHKIDFHIGDFPSRRSKTAETSEDAAAPFDDDRMRAVIGSDARRVQWAVSYNGCGMQPAAAHAGSYGTTPLAQTCTPWRPTRLGSAIGGPRYTTGGLNAIGRPRCTVFFPDSNG